MKEIKQLTYIYLYIFIKDVRERENPINKQQIIMKVYAKL